MEIVVLLGAPGSGKGTVAAKVSTATGFLHISTGDMLRESIKQGTDIGREAEGYMKRGTLVPDAVMVRLVETRLREGKSKDCYMLDGFPRTLPQADLLDQALAKIAGTTVRRVFFFDTSREVLIDRLTGRRTCKKCGANFHIRNIPPKKAGICDVCGGTLIQRPDDQEETILKRLKVYNEQTESLIAYYRQKGVLVRLDSGRPADVIVKEMLPLLEFGDGGRSTGVPASR